MSSINIQKHLACHDYHMGHCALPKQKCPYSHVGTSWGICPNKSYCPTPHKLVDCPLFAVNSCPKGDACSYRHTKKDDEKTKNDNTNQIEEEQKLSDISNQQQSDTKQSLQSVINTQQTSKGLTIEDFKQSLLELNQDLKILKIHTDKDKEREVQVQTQQVAQQNKQKISLDLCFIVDITGSMSSYMQTVKNYMLSTVKTLDDDFEGLELRVAFSGYRDHCDANQYVIVDFTEDVNAFNHSIATVSCSGGGDTAEDVCGGLQNALDFQWQSTAKQAIFIADSPAHGIKYHNGVSDDHPNGDPHGRYIEVLMKIFASKEITFTCIDINSSTSKMFNIMKTEYGPNLSIKSITANPGIVSGADKKTSSVSPLAEVIHEEIKTTVTASISKSGLNTGRSSGSNNNQQVKRGRGERSSFQKAFEMILENKRFKQNFSKTKSRERGTLTGNLVQQMIEENKILQEEEEYDSDDSNYDSKLEQTIKNQYTVAVKEKEIREIKAKEEKIDQLKKLYPSYYFDTVEEYEERTNKKKQKKVIQKVAYHYGKLQWDTFESSSEYQAICHSFELVKNQKSEINWKNLETKTNFLGTKVKINDLVFSEGAMRYAYQAKDLYLKQNMVAKQYKKVEKQKAQTVEDMKRDILSQIVCKYIVKEFNSRMLEIRGNEAILFNFIDCYIYEMTYPYISNNLYYFEKYIDGKYEKFNNNAGYVSESQNIYSSLAQTLSHFSWQLTKGYLAIVDLQGNSYGILTDPQVHCLDSEKFGDGNLGYEGILRFFATHKCNDYCRMLQLINPLEQSSIPLNNPILFDNSLSNNSNFKDPTGLMSQLCDICSNLNTFMIQEYSDVKKNNSKLVCKECKEQIAKSTFDKKCPSCTNNFTFSTYECIQLRRDAPPLCNPCSIQA